MHKCTKWPREAGNLRGLADTEQGGDDMAESSDWERVELHQRPQLMGVTIGKPPPAFLERFVGVETPPSRFRVAPRRVARD